MSPARQRKGRTTGEQERNAKIKKEVVEQEPEEILTNDDEKASRDEEIKTKNTNAANKKSGRKRAIKVEEEEQRKRIKTSPDNKQPQRSSGRGMGKQVKTKEAEEETDVKKEIKEEIEKEEQRKGIKTSNNKKPQRSNGRRMGKREERKETKEECVDVKKEIKEEKDKPVKKMKKGEDTPVARPLKYKSLGVGPPAVPSTGRKYMGSHVSAAGGVWNAFENAKECSSKSFAIFLRNQRQWNAKALDEETVDRWKEAAKDFAPHLILPHGSYLMNLGSPDPEVLQKSRNMLVDELERCERLGIPHYNFHPGSTTGKITREECCRSIAESINIAHSQTKHVICVLENMSCQGFTIGGDLHELRLIIEHVKNKRRVGVCLDTCHSHAAGYDLSTEEGFEKLLQDFERIIGWQFLRGLHINDSKGKPGDHLDRHENIGKGTIGLEGFRRVMNCEHFNDLPMILETPWTSNEGYAKEVKKLESIIKK